MINYLQQNLNIEKLMSTLSNENISKLLIIEQNTTSNTNTNLPKSLIGIGDRYIYLAPDIYLYFNTQINIFQNILKINFNTPLSQQFSVTSNIGIDTKNWSVYAGTNNIVVTMRKASIIDKTILKQIYQDISNKPDENENANPDNTNTLMEYIIKNGWIGFRYKYLGVAFGKEKHLFVTAHIPLLIDGIRLCVCIFPTIDNLNIINTIPIFSILSIFDTIGIGLNFSKNQLVNKSYMTFILLGGWIEYFEHYSIIYTLLTLLRSIFNIQIICGNILEYFYSAEYELKIIIKILNINFILIYDKKEWSISISLNNNNALSFPKVQNISQLPTINDKLENVLQ